MKKKLGHHGNPKVTFIGLFTLDPSNYLVENNISEYQVEKRKNVILVIDDNPVQAITRKAILNRAGLEAETAYSAEAAFEALDHDEDGSITLVITDHIMPGESGAHFVEMLWERRADLSVMVLSGLTDAESEYAGLNITFRSKPIMPSELVALATQLSHTTHRTE